MSEKVSDFQSAASEDQTESFPFALFALLVENKKWWLLPIRAVLLLFGFVVLLSGTAAAPFIYALF